VTVAVPPTSGRSQRRRVLGPVAGLVVLGICGLVVAGVVTSQVGLGGVLVGAVVALLPVTAVVGTFLWVDRWEPEPPRLLLLAFGWGACVATATALLLNSTARLVGDAVLGHGGGDVVSTLGSAPLVEEAAKGAFVVGVLVARRREFDGVVDGVVYAGISAAGFAFTENVLYFGRAFGHGGLGGVGGQVLAVFVLRGLLSPFAHPMFTALIGIGVGIAAGTRSALRRWLAPVLGYLGAVALHALWNGSALVGGDRGFVVVYVMIMVPLFGAMVWLVIWQRRREQRVVAAQVPALAAAGWIAPSEVGLLASLAGRRGWRAAARAQSGDAAADAVARYQAAVTELAFFQTKLVAGTAGEAAVAWRDELLRHLAAARATATSLATPGAA
jgi:RsiW-degrading membrane proteinase PrsW (M82 family)